MPPGAAGPVVELHIGDVLQLRKPHACGGDRWEVVRLGADIGIRCQQCQHRVLLARSVLERRIVAFIERGDRPSPDADDL